MPVTARVVCLCGHARYMHEPPASEPVLTSTAWLWVKASRCSKCPCMRFRIEQVGG